MKLATRLTIAMVALVLLTATAVGLLTYRNVAALALPLALNRIDTQARVVAVNLDASVRGARADAASFRISIAVIDIMTARLKLGTDPAAADIEAEQRRHLALRFVAMLAAKPNYHAFRLVGVDDGGRELVRVDRSGPDGAIQVAAGRELQSKGDRDAFTETIGLPDGQIYVSPIDLNEDNGILETPQVPVMRVGTPVYGPDGHPFGTVIVDVDMRRSFASVASGESGQMYLVNERGDYLVHPDRSREFGFALGMPDRVQDDFPDFAGMLALDETTPRVIADRAGTRFGTGWKTVRLADGPRVTVIDMLPYSRLVAATLAVRNSSLLGGGLAVLGALALAVLLGRSLTTPLVQMTKAVEGFGRNESIAVPHNGSPEIRVLASAFARMAAEARASTAALKTEIEERRRIFDASLDLILVVDCDGTLVQVSPSSLAILGYCPDEMIGRGAVEFIDPADLATARAEIRSARHGHPMRNAEIGWVSKPAKTVTLAWSGAWSEAAQQYVFIGRDITAKTKAAQALRDSEHMAREIIAGALDAFIQIDESGEILEWNPQAETTFGWSRQEATGKHLADLCLPAGYRPHYLDLKARLRGADESARIGERFEFEAVRKDGQKIQVETTLTAIRRGDGYVFNGFVKDLSERIAAEEKVRQAQKMEVVGQLTGGIAHDFNNMLTVITGTIDILAEGVAEEPQLAAIARLISEAADRGAELTGRLLAFARKQPLQPRETDVNALMLDSINLIRSTLGARVEIGSMLAKDVWPALVDPGQLSTAILNLALNARDAMPDGGKLTLETDNVVLDESYAHLNNDVRPGNYVMIAISDSGTGIPKAILDRIFEPFFSTKEVGKGTGLGLSMVYGFAKQSSGHIKVYSEEGHGTTFRVYLPQAGDALSEPRAEVAREAPVEGDGETILVVEDDPLVRSYVVTQLHDLGYRTLLAADAAEALAVVDGGAAFDLLFTDMIMPGAMNGRQLADEVAKRRPPLKVLFTSGYTEDAIIHHGRLDSGVLLLAKPYRKTALARMIRIALDQPSAAPRSEMAAIAAGQVG